jgi:chromosomal replication initiator protein
MTQSRETDAQALRSDGSGSTVAVPVLHLNREFTFNSFVEGRSNEIAKAAAAQVADNAGQSYNPLLIYGGVGLGKTHLMQAVGNRILQKNPKTKVLYVTGEKFTNELIDGLQGGRKSGSL